MASRKWKLKNSKCLRKYRLSFKGKEDWKALSGMLKTQKACQTLKRDIKFYKSSASYVISKPCPMIPFLSNLVWLDGLFKIGYETG